MVRTESSAGRCVKCSSFFGFRLHSLLVVLCIFIPHSSASSPLLTSDRDITKTSQDTEKARKDASSRAFVRTNASRFKERRTGRRASRKSRGRGAVQRRCVRYDSSNSRGEGKFFPSSPHHPIFALQSSQRRCMMISEFESLLMRIDGIRSLRTDKSQSSLVVLRIREGSVRR